MQSSQPSVRLNSGLDIPRLGFGVYQVPRGEPTERAVLDALRAGYRHIDTARIYGNERDVGSAVRASGVPRAELFITTKLWNDDQGFDPALRAFDASSARLGLDYVDLYLLHWPVPQRRLESWRALERLLADKRVRAIGVSNFMRHHLEELLAAAQVVPAVNQIELSPFLQQRQVRDFCRQHCIAVEAYSPLTRGRRFDDPAVVAVARAVGRSPAQVLLRWGVQHDLIVLPKSVHTARIAENAAIFDFELSPAQMQTLDALEAGLVTGWDPRHAP
jgi:diketogulonate reductase-like aldo/keto reductase